MTIKDRLDKAEKLLKKLDIQHTLGKEIESLKVELAPKEWQAEYKRLYVLAKRQNPEIWVSSCYNLPADAYYNNKEFFEVLDYIANLEYLCDLYPEHKKELQELFNHEDCIELMCDYLHWYFQHYDYTPPYKDVRKEALEKIKIRNKSISVIDKKENAS